MPECQGYSCLNVISFDVTSLFTNVPLDFTFDVILKRTYDENEVNTNMPKQQMRDLLLLCTKSVHLSFNGDVYTQADSVAMGSPLGPVLAVIRKNNIANFERIYESMEKICK